MIEHEAPLALAQRFAASLGAAAFVVDKYGTMLYYNAGAEQVLGRKFDMTGSMPASTWTRLFLPTDASGTPMLPDRLPLMVALEQERPEHSDFWILGIDNVSRKIQVAAMPITEKDGTLVGAMAIFWESQ